METVSSITIRSNGPLVPILTEASQNKGNIFRVLEQKSQVLGDYSDKIGMIKTLCLLAFFVFSLPVFSCETRNHIFLIHGISGSINTFGSMEQYLNKIDSCHVTTSFGYDTGNSSLSTYDFAQHFHQFVLDKVNSGVISQTDKISLIMHSQGGVIGNIWLNAIRQMDQALFLQIDSFITLSTPHWGADMANLGKSIFFTLPPGMGNALSPFGRIELNEMSYGSGTIRELVWSHDDVLNSGKVRPLALAGHKKGINLKTESDVVVPVYSSRADHYKGDADISLSSESVETTFVKTKTTPLVLVNATHIKMDQPGIADIPTKCLTEKFCDHPSITSITQHLKGRSIASDKTPLKQFRINLYVNNGSVETIDEKDLILEVKKTNNVTLAPMQGAYYGKASLKNGKAFTIEGQSLQTGARKMMLSLKIKNITRLIPVEFEGGFSTLVNVNLID